MVLCRVFLTVQQQGRPMTGDDSVRADVYSQIMRLLSDIFPVAGWPQPPHETPAEWLLTQPWRSKTDLAAYQHLLPWQPDWAAFNVASF